MSVVENQSDIGKGEFDTHRSNLEKLLGRKPMKLKEFLAITYGS
jgi:NAD(P)H dehydrogenase (quinone)